MIRATPYCRVSPMAISAYMPPSTRPVRTAFVILSDQIQEGRDHCAFHAGFGTTGARAPSLPDGPTP